ncbi:MAG: nitrile hydratase accessory protein [Ferrovibrio sp.]|uniref:nitrile hydratase accessory protein n=1 Tax=Ferrovibrio sp. TaxID=1917215 RepID=UPI00262D6F0B|nr:nitrile hydratase accessory protein [Ferrovibrio sp.]MCW0231970.1 nitrile hydratase accessory protein [Ferrovibrio sp.]
MNVSLSDILPELPCDETAAPVFHAPWEAQAFAMAVSLHQKGLFTWTEWAAVLSAEIRAAQAAGDPDTGATYYQHWLRALERLTVEKGAATPAALQDKAAAWDRAARATPHGQPIIL